MSLSWHLECAVCAQQYPGLDRRYRCDCGGVLDVIHDLNALKGVASLTTFDDRLKSRKRIDKSGVWRFRELILPVDEEMVAARPEGNTNLYCVDQMVDFTGTENLWLKHEGENPTGSFKDRGMTSGVTAAKVLGMQSVAVASTGNTSASAAAYAARAGMQAYVFIPEGQIAFGKLSQALAYGAKTIQIDGDFDDAMRLVQSLCDDQGIYLLNSVNPFRIEGQKAIGFEMLQDLNLEVPDWIVLPGGNLGNNTAIAKGMQELKALNLIKKLPRIAVIQAEGANPLARAWRGDGRLKPMQASTVATAIKIGNPVSFPKSMRGLRATNGTVISVTDAEILHAKARVDAAGIGAEPASCATVAGVRKLIDQGVITPAETVVGILTGHVLKDPEIVVDYHMKGSVKGMPATDANPPVRAKANLEAIRAVLDVG